jgi:hypothetical protein
VGRGGGLIFQYGYRTCINLRFKELQDSTPCHLKAMSSTLVFPPLASTGTAGRSQLFSASNLSSISLMVNVSGRSAGFSPAPPGAELFRTPKRRDEEDRRVISTLASASPASGDCQKSPPTPSVTWNENVFFYSL